MRNTRILKNSLALYIRQILLLAVSLYSIRVVLSELGIEDYGLFTVISGVVGLCSFVPGALATTTQRYFSFAVARSGKQEVEKVAGIGWTLHVVVVAMSALLLGTVGSWFVSEHLKVPQVRQGDIEFLFQVSILAFCATVINGFYVSVIVANENMQTLAYTSVVEALLKLLSISLLTHIEADKLHLYAYLVLGLAVLSLLTHYAICKRIYPSWKGTLTWDSDLVSSMSAFGGWTLFGQFTTVVRNQAITILLNQSFNPGVVAARAIAINVATQIGIFSNSFNTSLYPPVVKAYAANERGEMHSLILGGSKLTFYLMWIFAWPLILEMGWIMDLWLVNAPQDVVEFTRLAIVESLVFAVSMPLAAAARAPGKMMGYELVLGSMQISIFVISWFTIRLGYTANSVYFVAIVMSILMLFARAVIVQGLIGLAVSRFLSGVVVPVAKVVSVSMMLSYCIAIVLPAGGLSSAVVLASSTAITAATIYFLGLSAEWRHKVRQMIRSRLRPAGG